MPDEPKSPGTTPSPAPPPRLSGQTSPEANKKTAPAFSPDAVSRTESKTSQFFRSVLRWMGLGLVVFGLGALAAIFLFYVPKANEVKLANQNLAAAEGQITDLQTEITNLKNQMAELSTLEETKQSLQAELDQARLHIHLLAALTDIRTAQSALAQDDRAAAQTALTPTAATLTQLQKGLANEQAETVSALLSRLKLAQGELESNPFAAQSDLEVLAVSLLELEQSLFSEP